MVPMTRWGCTGDVLVTYAGDVLVLGCVGVVLGLRMGCEWFVSGL